MDVVASVPDGATAALTGCGAFLEADALFADPRLGGVRCEVSPGVDLRRDIPDRMPFSSRVAPRITAGLE